MGELVETLEHQNRFLRKIIVGSGMLALVLGVGVCALAFIDSSPQQKASEIMLDTGEDFVWTKLGLEQIPFENWRDFSGDDSLFIKNLPFPGEDFTDSHFESWKAHVDGGAMIEGLMDEGYIMGAADHAKAKAVFDDYVKIPSTYSDPIVVEESLIDYRLQFATDIGSTMIGDTASKGRLVSPAGRRLREHFYRYVSE